LWRNAERRAAQGRYDDAVARIYRLLEWSAQWLLKSHCDLDTSDLPGDRVPKNMKLSPGPKGKIQTGLMDSWTLVGELIDGPAAEFIKSQRETLLGHLQMRNHSILAHGFTPINQEEWLRFYAWCREIFLPVLLTESGLKEMTPQLPDNYLW
jgi:CRISPR-associated protein (TIGR02710 family)